MSLKFLIFPVLLIFPLVVSAQRTSDEIHDYAEIMPQFVGGPDALNAFIIKHLKYPKRAIDSNIEGKVWLRFVVTNEGLVLSPEILKSVHPLLNDAALNVVRQMPRWVPGTNNGQAIAVRATVPITFQLVETMPDLPMPTFKGGDFGDFIQKEISYPADAKAKNIGGVAIVSFIIDETGKPSHTDIIQSADKLLDKETIRLVNLSTWNPATRNSKPVSQKITTAISFNPHASGKHKEMFLEAEDSTLSRLPVMAGGMVNYPIYLISNSKLYISNSFKEQTAVEIVRMKVDTNGSISDLSIKKSLGKPFDQEALRLVHGMPRWEPGKKDNKPIDCYILLSVIFTKENRHNYSDEDFIPTSFQNERRFMNLDNSPTMRTTVIGARGAIIEFGR